jgi:4-hydroxythreonine-4-phosphate dehydrogenase
LNKALKMTAKKIALTMGDPAGIGPQTIAMLYRLSASGDDVVKALLKNVLVFGDKLAMRRACELVDVDPNFIDLVQAGAAFSHESLPVYGKICPHAGRMAAACVEAATTLALQGKVAALVTAPLHKEALAKAGIDYPGHTEMLQAQSARFLGVSVDQLPVRMMLANDELRVVLESIHLPLRQALDFLSTAGIHQTIKITHDFLCKAGINKPRIAVAGVNPHAGEAGLFGTEELQLIAPAISAAQSQGIDASGPYPPDTVFMRARRTKTHNEFDVVIAMYHDQGLIPVKYLGVDAGVNVTLGLPFIRISPDHGTAFDIAGTKKADHRGLLYALKRAKELVDAGV